MVSFPTIGALNPARTTKKAIHSSKTCFPFLPESVKLEFAGLKDKTKIKVNKISIYCNIRESNKDEIISK